MATDGGNPSGVSLARAYYAALDGADYERLAGLLASDFVQHRPDQTLDGRERFVRFMREERPLTDTSHPIDAVYVLDGETQDEVAVRGRLLRADGSELVSFVDVFRVADGLLQSLRTYTH
jgi:ketosteroid isomerase-like protein